MKITTLTNLGSYAVLFAIAVLVIWGQNSLMRLDDNTQVEGTASSSHESKVLLALAGTRTTPTAAEHEPVAGDRLLCFIASSGEEQSAAKSRIVAQTWGAYCDKLVFIAPSPIPGINETMTQVIPKFPGETRLNLFPKIHASWKLVIENYAHEADWFLKADDDTFVYVPKFKEYVRNYFPRFIGQRFKHPGEENRSFASGGPGYALNRAALDLLSKAMDEGLCPLTTGPEDTRFADCMNRVGVTVEDTRDERGSDRFLHLPLEIRLNGRKMRKINWWKKRSFNLYGGKRCCSDDLISVHKLTERQMESYFYLFYKSGKNWKQNF
eukprot:TRINITY_DN4043_c0_g1_i3.p2 TRINITY_DN4043_c0_g1~~TRINITY_DN4043_c0_g1_i3.p2  ORF type:complete len:324 (-),score=65.10 TRINITY_DN4043_c0_g1_i3:262-1233(-)